MTDRLSPRTIPGTTEPPSGQQGPMPSSDLAPVGNPTPDPAPANVAPQR